MPKDAIRVATTKLGKQLSCYLLMRYDMEFAARAFALAAMRGVSSERRPSHLPLICHDPIWQIIDPVLRKGGVAQFDEVIVKDSEDERCALFEAGIVTYGRCFNSGMRTSLSKELFTGKFSQHRELHESMIDIRNKHIAHSELKMEQSIVGFRLVDDQNYGKRPNMILTTITMRRNFPTDYRLAELEAHCRIIAEQIIAPRAIKVARALREQLLQMPPEQLEKLPEFEATKPTLEALL